MASVVMVEVRGERHLLTTLQDVTDRNRAEAARRESEERLGLFIEHAPAALAMFDREMRYLNASRRWLDDYNLGGRDLRGLSHYEVFPEIPEAWKEIHRRGLAGEVLRADADRFERADGSVQFLRWEVRPWHDAQGQVGGIVIFSEDVSDSLTAEQERRESDTRFRELAENISEVFWLTDPTKGRVIYVSPGYQRIWGRAVEQLYASAHDWLDAIHPDDRDRVLQALPKQAEGTYDEEYRILRPDGEVRWIRDQAFPVRDASGRVIRLAGVAEDVTVRRQLEAQLRQTQKLESVGLLAGGVAHDFNNWLTVIASCTEMLLQDRAGDPGATELLGEVRHAADRAAALTRQLLAFSRQEVFEPRVLDLNDVVADTEKMLRRVLGEDIILTTVLSQGLGPVKVDPGHWSQVLMNLAVNARDAMPRGGHLTIETRGIELDEEYVRTHVGARPGPHVVLSMTDTGIGMTPEVRQRIFEPFYTTKGLGRGTGLGLAVVHGIVSQSGGFIEVYSEAGTGTTFRVYVPQGGEVARLVEPAQGPEELHGTETVLLVEDDERLRRITRRALVEMGYTVVEAENGEDALQTLKGYPGPVHLLLTDVVMPRLDGRQLAEQLASQRPELRVLYTSGYTDDAVVRHGVLQASVAFISKPYTPGALRRKVREVLDHQG